MEQSNKLIPSLSIWLLHFSVNKILLVVESLIVESPVKNCSLKDFLTLFTSQNQMNNDIPGNIYFSFVPVTTPNTLVPEIVLRLLKKNPTQSHKIKLSKICF